ncbi:MAG: hypothetical protein LAP38_01000 [Acidobacteriia bacterium]|nr:hypothetical protein [Terriglobia bacterium]
MVKIVFLVCLALNAASALGCECVPLSLNEAKAMAEVVFRGTITDIRAGKVFFRVDRVWKGNVGRTFDMPDFTESSACIGFMPKWLRVGNDLLVFATRLHRYPGDNDYFTNICSWTSLASEAGDALEKLGRGRLPRNSPAPSGKVGQLWPAKIRSAPSYLLSQAIVVVQPAEDRSRFDDMCGGKPMSMAAGRNIRLDGFRNARA